MSQSDRPQFPAVTSRPLKWYDEPSVASEDIPEFIRTKKFREAARAKHVRAISAILKNVHRTHIAKVEADILRYRADLIKTFDHDLPRIMYAYNDAGKLALELHSFGQDVQRLADPYLRKACDAGYARALTDLKSRGFVSSIHGAIQAPSAVKEAVIRHNAEYIDGSLLPDMHADITQFGNNQLRISARYRHRVGLYAHALWRASEVGYKNCLSAFALMRPKKIKESGTASSGDHGHAGRPGTVGGSAPSAAALEKFSGYPEAERDSVNRYTGFDYGIINGLLRTPATHDEPSPLVERAQVDIKNIDSVIGKSVTTEPITVYRGMGPEPFATPHELYYGMDRQKFDWNAVVGKTFTDLGYTSTTTSHDVAQSWDFKGVIAEIHVPAGIGAFHIPRAWTDTVNDEHEVLLQRGLKFHITSITQPKEPINSMGLRNHPSIVVEVSK